MRYAVELVDLQRQPAAVVRGHVDNEDGIGSFLGSAYDEIMAVVEHEGLQLAGAPFGRYRVTGDGGLDIEAGFPVHGDLVPEGRVVAGDLPGGQVARTLYRGDYGGVAEAYRATADWITDNGMVATTDAPWESYLDDPEVPTPRTEVFIPCQKAEPVHA